MASSGFPVAVIGMAVRLPAAETCEEFWKLLMNGTDSVGKFSPKRAADIAHAVAPFTGQLVSQKEPFFTESFFEPVDEFDADVFQINPREALFIEPEQRIFLETTWELLEDAGYASSIKSSRTGVYVGNTVNKYKYILTENHSSISHGKHSPFISSRVLYSHNLQGPALMVATGCSLSLLAVHLACQGLYTGDCEMAIAGGITLDLLPVNTKTDIWNQLGITGPNVRCRAFDAAAKGIAKGEGCGIVLLKPLCKAVSDGDHIYGILEASTANQDGHSNGITAPHPGAQAKLLQQAWNLANITPDQLDYFEAHGTGTELGDSIEISGITSAFRKFGLVFNSESKNRIPVGSVEANIGHLADGGAGIVSLIKVLLCLRKNKIPPATNFSKPNPHINWNTAPVYVNTTPLEWRPHTNQVGRFASVSAFGLLGTNTHVVVKEHISVTSTIPHPPLGVKCIQVLSLAANSKKSLIDFTAKMEMYFQYSENKMYTLLSSVCYTLNTGREHTQFHHRAIAYAATWEEMTHSLQQLLRALKEDRYEVVTGDSSKGFGTCYGIKTGTISPTLGIDSGIIAKFLNGKSVSWSELYSDMDPSKFGKVPMLPTYAFDRVRYWPKVGQPVNKELLQLEHALGTSGITVVKDVCTPKAHKPALAFNHAEKVIQAALNEALGTECEWNEHADENLFALGVDSLICTQVCMRLQNEIGCSFSMSEFHDNPTYTALKTLIEEKLQQQSRPSIPSIEKHPSDVGLHLKAALNEALGKTCDWEELEDQNIFSLGVDSLICTHICMKLKGTLGLDVPLTMAELHENPSCDGLCSIIRAKMCQNNPASITNEDHPVTTCTAGPSSLFPMSFAQRRLWAMQEMATNPCAYNATNCLRITGDFHPVAFVEAVNTVLSRHGAFHTVFIDGQDGPLQTHNWSNTICVEESNLLMAGDRAEDTVLRSYTSDYKTPFDLKRGPLVRCRLYHLPKSVTYFTMVIHHIVFDGWSHFVFYNELWDVYTESCKGQKVSRGLKTPLYVEFDGSYGIVSIVLLSKDPADSTVIHQWVLSCRALQRGVEQRILHEIHSQYRTSLQLVINKTGRNVLTLAFLSSLGLEFNSNTSEAVHVFMKEINLPNLNESLHQIEFTNDAGAFEGKVYSSTNVVKVQQNSATVEHVITGSLTQVNQWIDNEWSPSLKQQSIHHDLFPLIPACEHLTKSSLRLKQLSFFKREQALIATWMEALQSSKEPQESENFLNCGGDSLSAVFLVSKLRRTCEVDITPQDLLQNPNYGEFKAVVLRANRIRDQTQEDQPYDNKCLPLSTAQQRMVVMNLTAPHSTAYVQTIACYTRNAIHNPANIFEALAQRHQILTSRIETDPISQKHVISPQINNLAFVVQPEVVQDFQAVKDYIKDSIPVIEIVSSELVRFRILTVENIIILIIHVHHVIVDEITMTCISSDLQKLVGGATLDTESSELTYASFVDFERKYLNSSQYADDAQFWKETFTTLPCDANLAILPESESAWKDTHVYTAREKSWLISRESMETISDYCNTVGVTSFQYYLACASLVIQRYLGVGEIALAIPVTARTDVHKHTDGLFVNTVMFTICIDLSMTWKEYLNMVSTRWLKTLHHSQYPLDHVTKTIWKEHGKSVGAFCTVMFNYKTHCVVENEVRVPSRHAKMPLSLDLISDSKSRTTNMIAEWAIGLLDDGIVERIADGLVNLCCHAFNATESQLQDINVLSPLEHKLLDSFNGHPKTESGDEENTVMLVHKAFEKYAAANPDALAVWCNGVSISYEQLNEKATRIAHVLQQNVDILTLKTRPVVIVMDKSTQLIASIFGIWKAGGHFLPVASNTSAKSCLWDVLERCRPAVILFAGHLDIAQEIGTECLTVSVEEVFQHSSKEYTYNTELTDVEISDDDLAYIIRTSGSTGRPKQCKVSHRSLRTIAHAWTEGYNMNKFKVNVLQWAPLSFDVFVGDVVRGLVCAPGQLTICPDNYRLDVSYILNLIKEHEITVAEVTPMFGLHLVENACKNDLETLKILILGSDVLQQQLFMKVRDRLRLKDQRVINSYGMTEATIDSSFFEGRDVPKTRSGTVPIGRPLPGVSMHILDNALQPCPVGTKGELYISGKVLASGDVETTWLKHCNCWGLKTGDAACWLPSGDIELFGRLDSMVKLRGFRISTTEIENKIIQLVRGVRDACVVPLSNDDSSNGVVFLCAFVELNEGIDPSIVNRKGLCNQLKGELPYYMLPDVVHILDEIPLTAHGKIDRKALPRVSNLLKKGNEQETTGPYGNSQTVTTLKQLFSEALGMTDSSQIHHELTFMEQGGHSLILVRFSSLIKQKTNFDIGIADIFSYPSINALANHITERSAVTVELKHQDDKGQGNRLQTRDSEHELAITGIGLRLPGGIMSLPQLWDVLDKGNDLIRNFPEARANDVHTCLSPAVSNTYSDSGTFQGAFLEHIDLFDHHFFKIAPGEAKFMSPEQRLFLQVATEALAEGKGLSQTKGASIGVFVGYSDVGYSQLNHPDEPVCVSGLMPGMIATRVAYQWDLKGPTMLVDTACSSSLVALKQACESIKRNECEGALDGGVSLVLYPSRPGVFGQTNILSPDFQCRAFDRDANGTAVGEGVLCVYIEPLSRALEEEKAVYGVIKGIESNQVGHGNGISAPTSSSQQKVIQEALNAARINPSDVTFVECHGSGTKLGDRIELSALGSVFNETHKFNPLPIGSVKSMLGHLDSASGLLGVFKILASFMLKQISPTAHFKSPHPELTPSLTIPTKSAPWVKPVSGTRVAGVSSFGATGTNCHVILAEGNTSINDQVTKAKSCPLLLSGNSFEHIKKQSSLYKVYVQQLILKVNSSSLVDLCLSVAQRLRDLAETKGRYSKCRMVIIAKDATEVMKILDVIQSAEDDAALIKFVDVHSDIHLYCSQSKELKQTSAAIHRYLLDGNINVEALFPNRHPTRAALGVTVVMYEDHRHWIDQSSATLTETSLSLLGLVEQKLEDTREMVRMLPLSPPEGLNETQGKFCAAIIIELLLKTDMAKHLHKGSELMFKEAFILSGALEKYEKFFWVMVRELLNNGLVIPTGSDESFHRLDSFKCKCEHCLDIDPEGIANSAIERYPSWADCFRFPLYCSKSLHDVLQGRISPLSVIYPQGDLNFMYQFNKLGDLLGNVYYNMYMQVIAAFAIQLSKQRKKVRVLEVGAGMGHVTRQLLPKLKDATNIEYWFTDLGKAFVDHAKTLFADYRYMMRFSTFDITKSAPKQGLLGSFDIVISYNVIHTTESIMDSVVNLKTCLGNDGTLFIIESAKNKTWATLAWGILDGWWFFKDYHLRPAEPMLEPEKWERVLEESGFASVHSIPVDVSERSHVEKFLFICTTKLLKDAVKLRAPKLGWWDTDAHRFDPVKKFDELEGSHDTAGLSRDIQLDRQAILTELKGIWSELLGVDNIREGDDFNFLGGESLLAIKMMNEVHRRIGYQLEIADTFGYPTLGALATFIFNEIQKLPTRRTTSQPATVSTPGKDHQTSGSDQATPNVTTDEIEAIPRVCPPMTGRKGQGTLLMFPGQGAQKAGMCSSMKDSPEAKAIFKRAEHVLGYNVLDICLKNDSELEEKLKSTEFVQVSLFTGCIAKVEQMKAERPDLICDVTHVAGLSVGEFAAIVYAGVIDFETGLKLVQERGKVMEAEISQSSTAMVSVFGPECKQLQAFLKENFPSMKISTYLADNQHTIAGTRRECDALVENLQHVRRETMAVIDVRKLRVAGAFHSFHMERAAAAINPVIGGLVFSKPSVSLIMNVNGQIIEDPVEIKALLCQQLVAPVKWKQTVLRAYASGVRNFVEVSPGRVLSSIVKKRIADCKDCTVEYIVV